MDELSAPTLIIAMPQLLDPNFHRTVVLLVEKNEEGAFGLVVNRSTENRVDELCRGLDLDWGGSGEALAQFGGPVSTGQGFLLHGEVEPESSVRSREIMGGIQLALDMETFRTLCAEPPPEFKMFLGYAGWGAGQLEREILEGAWLTTDVTPELIFETPLESIWNRALACLGVDPSRLVASESSDLH